MRQLVTFQALPDLGMTLPQYFSGLSKTGVSADPPAGRPLCLCSRWRWALSLVGQARGPGLLTCILIKLLLCMGKVRAWGREWGGRACISVSASRPLQ